MLDTLIVIILNWVGILPFSWLQRFGKALGWLFFWFPNDVRNVTLANLAYCLPELSLRERRQLAMKSLQHTGMSLFEMIAIWHKSPATIARYVKKDEVWPKREDHPHGMIFLLPHLGSWETFTIMAAQAYPVVALYRPQKSAVFNRVILKARQREGMEMVPTNSVGVRALYRALAEQKVLGILPDQDPGDSGGTFVPFFDQPALTMTLAMRLAKKSQAKIFFTYASREAIGKGFRTYIIPANAEVYSEDIQVATAAMNQQIEAIVRRCPEQYQWSYKRFKRQPFGENIYD